MEGTQQEQQAPAVQVSVIIVSRNCAAALRKCLAALEQTQPRELIEVIVADNASRDGSAQIDSEFPHVSMLRLPHHVGLTKARNIAIRTAKAEFLLLLSPSVEVAPDTVSRLVEHLRKDSTALAACPEACGARALPTQDQVASHWRDPWTLPEVPRGQAVELHDGKALLIRKISVQGMNYLDERYGEHWGDVELAFQVRRAGKRIVPVQDARVSLNSGDPLWTPADSHAQAAYAADAATGAAAYIGKHFGFGAGVLFRVKLALGTLLRVLTFQDLGVNTGLLTGFLGGSKIDGTDRSL
ncbi:MAG: glycosyltransferase [Acidobacteria bacterium]|nr:glycosyltransferase [Acidobacteriota bacterium]